MTEQKLQELLNDMTLEEKVNQLLQLPGSYYQKNAVVTGGLDNSEFTKKQISQAGSVLGIHGADTMRSIQDQYMEKHSHHIPLLFMLDVIHGLRTIFPMPLAQGATFDPEITEACAKAAAKESSVSGVHVTFAPMADLVQDARWGRVMESTGEDPFLNGILAAAMVRGFQGDHVGKRDRVAACVKHFAGYGAPIAGKEYNTVELSEHTLREFYLPSYQAAIDAGSELVMTSFNTLSGIPSSGNRWLMRKVLREQMRFEGVLISDWGAIKEMIAHGFCEDEKEAAKKAIEAGIDIDMVTAVYCKNLAEMVEQGDVEEQLVDEAVLRVLRLKNKLGLFENPYKEADAVREKEVILCEEHRQLARKAARESFVLLKNEKRGLSGETVLPLKSDKKVAFIGPYVENNELHSSWAIAGKAEDAVTIRQAVKEMMPGFECSFCQGSKMVDFGENLCRHSTDIPDYSLRQVSGMEKEKELEAQALLAAKEADVVVFCMGEHRLQSGEAASRGNITVPDIQMKLFRKVCEVNDCVAAVVFGGRPLDLREVSEKAAAVLEVWMPGTEGGHAIMDVLTGAYNPSGKLPMSFPYCVGQTPVYYNHYATGRPCAGKEDKTFYKSRYVDIPNEPLYPFGYGLSYTKFDISPISLSSHIMSQKGECLKASVQVKNVGDREGTAVLQMYLRDISASVVRPVKELKGFIKVLLKPGEEQRAEFEIKENMLEFYTMAGGYESEKGKFSVWIGDSSDTENRAEFVLQ